MRKIDILIIGCLLMAVLACKAKDEVPAVDSTKSPATGWKLIFEDQFNTAGNFDQDKWTFCSRGNPAWARYLTSSQDYASQANGFLTLTMDKRRIEGDDIPYHSGGIQSKNKFSFLYGKVEVRAKFKAGQGSWPAIWMMPENSGYGNWPNSGEIDIMEHVNNQNVVHQTIHNASVTNADGGSSATHTASYKADDFNTYGIIWSSESIKFYVNGELQFTYTKPSGADSKAWPFDQPFYLILNQSGGLGWPGPITDSALPFSMQVDWVKVYQED
jgi:beta-glucanase (GH16 family)